MTNHQLETPPDVPGYEITRLIGLGGMGEVYLAHHQILNRAVAIKFLTRTTRDLAGEREQRFRREIELMARVSHPNVLTIFDFGTAHGRPYLVMEYVPTGDLRSRMVPGSPIPIDEVRELLGPVIRAVESLHRQGIIHRDLKPENILIHEGVPKVTDLGIAVLDDHSGTLTRSGVALGTMGYVAPEQQYRLKVDERVDQYSLAAMAYELVTGRRPLGAFPPPSKLNPKLGRAADAAILKGLSDDPTDRFASISEFGEALDRGLAGNPRRLFDGRSRWLVAGSLLGISLLGAGILTLADLGRPSSPKSNLPAGSSNGVLLDPCPIPDTMPRAITAQSANLKLVLVPPGKFAMGSPATDIYGFPEERPQHQVQITRGFYLGETEVTVEQFRRFVEAKKYRTSAETGGGGWRYSEKLVARERNPEWTWRNPGGVKPQADNSPVVQVSWDDAQAFCQWLSKVEGREFRLPTEAEWEYACRAGTGTRWSCGDTSLTLNEFAWTLQNTPQKSHPVRTRKPNPFGLYDMHGNVWEWCADWIGDYSGVDAIDPKGPSSGQARILRGGSFDWNNINRTRSASRIGLAPNLCYLNYGFRVCSTASE